MQSQKFSFHSVIHGLGYSLKGILESKSKFTQHHTLLSQRQHCQHNYFITRDLIQVLFQILVSCRYHFGKMFVDKNSLKRKNNFQYLYPNSMKADKVKGESVGL